MKFNSFRIAIVIVSIFSGFVVAQNSSTYTRNGIGDVENSYSARSLGIGEAGSAISDADFINMINPAGWSGLRTSRLEFGVNFSGLTVEDNNNKSYFGKGQFTGITLAFPVSTKYGIALAMGIVPYSNVSYKSKQYMTSTGDEGNYNISYEGSGGLNKLFLGTSLKLFNDFELGATLEYISGDLNYNTQITFENTNIASANYERSVKPKGVGTTLGLITPDINSLLGIKNIKNLKVGFSADIIGKLSSDTLLISYTTYKYSADTANLGSADMKVPYRLNFGLSFIYSDNYQIFADYTYQPWTNYSLNNAKYSTLRDLNKFTAGFEYHPTGPGSGMKTIWRGALGYEQTQYNIDGNGINKFFVSGGFSLPLSPENTMDIGLQAGFIGKKEVGLVRENFINLSAGFSFGEIWFFRSDKY
jgi:hypothetical protein